jgi:hypothetical protein
MNCKRDWHYGKKTKILLSKRKKNNKYIYALLNGLKKVSINIKNLFTLIPYLITFLIFINYSIYILGLVSKFFSIIPKVQKFNTRLAMIFL